MFSDVCNYPASRHCLVEDKEILHRLLSTEEKAPARPESLSAGEVVVNEKVKGKLGTQPGSTDMKGNIKSYM